MVVKLNTKEIGLAKPINVHATVDTVDLADQMMIKMLELDDQVASIADNDDQTKGMLETLKLERSFTKGSMDFLQKVLRLSDKQVQQVRGRIDYQTLGNYISYVCQRLKGMSEKAYQEARSEQESAPKEPAPK